MYQTVSIGILDVPFAVGKRLAQALIKESRIEGFYFRGQLAQRDLRGGAVVGDAEWAPFRIVNLDRIARLGLAPVYHVTGEYPGMSRGQPVGPFTVDPD